MRPDIEFRTGRGPDRVPAGSPVARFLPSFDGGGRVKVSATAARTPQVGACLLRPPAVGPWPRGSSDDYC
ncbi:hypothetical protein GCM10009759_58800 [Kitasatospora saccharophila]|uniref:Uncharacterized protein n=1 Tax=Kitasatospora saccharophila TaxID=407973 RepID=A0ABN2XNN2_9ACTN